MYNTVHLFYYYNFFFQGELSSVLEDYSLLEQMNKATITKYADMRQIGGSVSRALKDLNEKYLALQPYLEQIDQIEDSVTKLEAAAYKLDAYSKRLETKFKSLEKKWFHYKMKIHIHACSQSCKSKSAVQYSKGCLKLPGGQKYTKCEVL